MVKLFFYSINLYMKLEDLTTNQLKKLAKFYNLHQRIPNINKLSREDLLDELYYHIGIDEENHLFYVVQHDYDLEKAIGIKPKKKKKEKEKIKKEEEDDEEINEDIGRPAILKKLDDKYEKLMVKSASNAGKVKKYKRKLYEAEKEKNDEKINKLKNLIQKNSDEFTKLRLKAVEIKKEIVRLEKKYK